jgi:hypothetical protein
LLHFNANQGKKGSLSFKSAAPKISVFPAMLRTFGTPFFVGSAVKILYDTLAVFNPQFMKWMIGYVESQFNSTKYDAESGIEIDIPADPQEEWKGYFYAFLLLIVTVFQVNICTFISRMVDIVKHIDWYIKSI